MGELDDLIFIFSNAHNIFFHESLEAQFLFPHLFPFVSFYFS